jgi:hypothetical protein
MDTPPAKVANLPIFAFPYLLRSNLLYRAAVGLSQKKFKSQALEVESKP